MSNRRCVASQRVAGPIATRHSQLSLALSVFNHLMHKGFDKTKRTSNWVPSKGKTFLAISSLSSVRIVCNYRIFIFLLPTRSDGNGVLMIGSKPMFNHAKII